MVFFGQFLEILTVATITCVMAISYTETRNISTDVRSPCLFNSTHCSCRNVEHPGTCLRHLEGPYCTADQCSGKGFTCDCSGTQVCELTVCKVWISTEEGTATSLRQEQNVGCRLVTSTTCLLQIGEIGAAPPKGEEPDFRMVQFGAGSDTTMFNMSAFIDEGNFISKSYEMHGKWKNANRLLRRYITLRMYDLDGEDNHMLCAIYNSYGISDDGLGNMKVKVEIKGKSGQSLEWVACDDIGECKENKGSSLQGEHFLVSYLTDGWCVKPLEWNGNVVSVKFSDVHGMRGVMMQSTAGREETFKFGEGYGMTGSVDENKLVHGGSTPEILFDLKGMEVPF